MSTRSDAGEGAGDTAPSPRENPLAFPWACRVCGAYALRYSRPRTRFQRVVLATTPLVLYRCHDCLCQGWHLPTILGGAEKRALSAGGEGAARRARRDDRTGAVRRLIASERIAAWRARLGPHGGLALVLLVGAAIAVLVLGIALTVRKLRRPPAVAVAAAPTVAPRSPTVEARLLGAASERPATASPAAEAAPSPSPAPARPVRRAAARDDAAVRTAEAAGEAPAREAWGLARWGMSLHEVRRALPEARVTAADARPGSATGTTQIAGRQYTATLWFDDGGGLGSIELAPADDSDPSRDYAEVLAWLEAQHGPPSSVVQDLKPSGSWARVARWSAGAGEVQLRAWNRLLDDARVLQLGPGEVRLAPYGLRVTFQPPRGATPAAEETATTTEQ
jgi:hypothetical protein